MTEEQIDLLRHLIRQEIDAAQIDGMEHGVWGWADRQLEEGWKCFKDSLNETNALVALKDLYANNDNGMKNLAKDSPTHYSLMTSNIYPPDHLLRKWEELIIDEEENVDVVLYEAFQAGADQQLEQDAKWLDTNALYTRDLTVSPSGDALRQVMRPKPPSLKEQALSELDLLKGDANAHGLGFDAPAIRRALESLPS